ncbi:MAG: hypothetical protein EXR49_04355 [Dehalococcoidia bacterium]|nr:hypothetical protein [Dehalococcoidia bacterium]
MPGAISRADAEAIREGARRVLAGNVKRGHDNRFKTDYAYVCPARGDYPWQWFWDSCFHAVALCHLDAAMAKGELRTLLQAQHADGFIPHIVHWGARLNAYAPSYLQSKLSLRPRGSALMQPPVLGQAALRVYERTGDKEFLDAVLPGVKRYYLWLHDRRDPDADGLISVISPYETGMDHLPAYDAALGAKRPSRLELQLRDRLLDLGNLVMGRNYNLDTIFRRDKFNVEDVLVNCVYAQGLRAVARLCRHAGDEASGESFTRMAGRTEGAVLAKCYDAKAGAFWGLSGKSERPLRVMTISSLMPLLLGTLDKTRATEIVERHVTNAQEFWLEYPAPSVAASEREFRPSAQFLIWRGPAWINMNWLLWQGLRLHGFDEIADRIAERSAALVLQSGFREFYNPHTGEGYGAKDFGWSTLVVDML